MQDPISRIGALAAAVDTLTASAVPASPQWDQLHDRWTAFLDLDQGASLDRLADAVAVGDVDAERLALLAAGASLSASPGALAELRQGVARRLLPRFELVAAQHGRTAHTQIAKRFNAAADRLVAAVKVAAPVATAEDAVRAPDDMRAAYVERADMAPALDQLGAALVAAAQLAGQYLPNPDAGASQYVDFDKVTPKTNRLTWAALTPGRVDWPALAALGVLGARPLGVPAEPRHPGCEVRLVRSGIGHGQRAWDPIAGEYVV